ncbi:acyl-CoA dehydrogenase [Streptomyces bambusae]|uniref:acyl-CoA dehydrogenase family protein n=1 Tax=Streptomyces bambusae TaxID=1550616 RepID=UPI001CFCC658|nr:acyl-CoA dehydrogenase family protein [Streptomyces bambusae]MCB5168918.1 acyl-CoA dehydrogenase [Streptomyces bambusae]
MDFRPTEDQAAAAGLAADIFADLAGPERLAAAGTGSDAELWKALTAAGLTAAVEDVGLLGLVLLLEEQGRTTAQVPYAATCVYGLLAIGAHGTAGQRTRLLPALRTGTAVATGAFPARGEVRSEPADRTAPADPADPTDPTDPTAQADPAEPTDPTDPTVPAAGEGPASARLTGTLPLVPWLRDAAYVLVPDRDRTLWLVRTDAPGATVVPVEATAPWSAGRLVLEAAEAERLGTGPQAYEAVLATARTAFAGLQAGVCAGSLARAVAHTSTREQFGRPLSTNQGVQLRAADAYMDTEAIRVTAYEAAWRIDQGLPARQHVLTAAWWASEAGKRVVHTGQHLHGGLGADLDHPVHRHFLWGRQLDAYLGSGAEILAELGASIAAEGPA